MAVATSFYNKWLNRWYLKLDRVHNPSIKASPWLKRVKFATKGGEGIMSRFDYSGHRSTTGDLASAQTISGNSRAGRKLNQLVPHGTIEGSIRVAHRDIALSRQGEKEAAARALQYEVDKGLKQHGADVNRFFWGPSGYALNATAATFATGTNKLTFATSQEVSNILPDDELEISANNGSSTAHVKVVGSAVGYVISRDIAAKTVTISATPNGSASTPTNWADSGSYFVFRRGTFLPGTNDMITPLRAFLPEAVATDTLHLLDRSLDPILSGFRTADASMTGKDYSARVKRTVNEHREQLGVMGENSEIDALYMNPVDWGKMEEQYSAAGIRDAAQEDAKDGYMYLTVMTANGSLRAISEPQCPRGYAFLLAQDDIVWNTPSGTIAEWVDQDGSIVSRMANENDLELRPVSYIAVKMGAPWKHARINLTA